MDFFDQFVGHGSKEHGAGVSEGIGIGEEAMDKVGVGAFDGTIGEVGRLERIPHRDQDFRDVGLEEVGSVEYVALSASDASAISTHSVPMACCIAAHPVYGPGPLPRITMCERTVTMMLRYNQRWLLPVYSAACHSALMCMCAMKPTVLPQETRF